MSPATCSLPKATGSVVVRPFFLPSAPRLRTAFPVASPNHPDRAVPFQAHESTASHSLSISFGVTPSFRRSSFHRETLRHLQPQCEVGRGQNVGATARTGKLVNFSVCDGRVHLFAAQSSTREQCEVRPHAAHGSRPACRSKTSAADLPATRRPILADAPTMLALWIDP